MNRLVFRLLIIALSLLLCGHARPLVAADVALTPETILERLGAKGRQAGSKEERVAYGLHFKRLDQDQDGRLSWTEYVENGSYLNPQSRAGIFRASDANQDRFVSRDEYIVNRQITDEAKAIMSRMDADRDGRVTRREFVLHSGVKDPKAAQAIFDLLDTDQSGATEVPEYLRVWGAWARSVPASASARGGTSARRGGGPGGAGFSGRDLPDLLERRGIRVGQVLSNVTVHTKTGHPRKLHALIGDRPTVIVGGCLTCPQFLRRYPSIEALHRDYGPKGIQFYYVYRALAHPENHGYIEPFQLEERLRHIEEAEQKLKTQVPWIADNMNNELKAAMGNINNPAFLLRPGGVIVHLQSWSDGEALRTVLADTHGPVKNPTPVSALGLPALSPRTPPGSGIVPRLEVAGDMVPLRIEPKPNAQPFYVKLRAEVEREALSSGRGSLYLGFHLDPIHDVHWNNLVAPLDFTIQAPEGTTVTPASGRAPKVDAETDADPREFLVALGGAPAPLQLTVNYFACSDAQGWCRNVKQHYTIHLEQDPFSGGVFGRSFAPGRGYGRPGRGLRGGPPSGGFHGGLPRAGGGPPDPTLLFDRFDRNNDKTLTESETPEFLWQRIRGADANRDDAVTLPELKAFRKSRGAP